MTLTIPKDMLAEISLMLASLPAIHGKVSLRIELDCGTGGHVADYSTEVTYRQRRKKDH